MAQRFYLIPIITVDKSRGPKYIQWETSRGVLVNPGGPDIGRWGMMDYGFLPTALLLAVDISDADHAILSPNSDVYSFPVNLDAPVADPTIDTFFEALNIPTDWLTPANTYRELLHQLAGMFQFNQRYSGISGGSLFDTANLDTRLRNMTAQEQEWFYLTFESFYDLHGLDRSVINDNAQLRQLVKSAGNFWAGRNFVIAGTQF